MFTKFIAFFVMFCFALAAPIVHRQDAVLRRDAKSRARHYVVYDNLSTSSLPPVEKLKGFDTFVLTFWQTSGPSATAAKWADLEEDERVSIKDAYNAAGIKILVSVFGALDKPTTQGADAIETANKVADWVKSNNVDGVDVDYEDEDALGLKDGSAEDWVITFTKTLRERLPVGDYLLTHAPLASFWSSGLWGDNAYRKIHREAGDLIDWYNIQYYNAGPEVYTTCSSLVESAVYAKSSVLEVSETVPLEKLVVLKPGSTNDADNGFMDPRTLGNCLGLAAQKGVLGGVGVWKYSSTINGTWVQSVKSALLAYKPKKNGATPVHVASQLAPVLAAFLVVHQILM